MWITYFPDGYPDELLYSMAARYAMHLRLPTHMTVYEEWFGTGALNGLIDLPTHLEHLVQALPQPHAYSADRIMDRHTLYPFYATFLPPERAHTLREGMCGAGQAIPWTAGIAHTSVPRPHFLRYCPHCVADDRHRWGETYWHRVHQLPGLPVCPLHRGWLSDSSVSIHSGAGGKRLKLHERFVAAEHVIPALLSLATPPPPPSALIHMAHDAFWVLHYRLDCGWTTIYARYHALLRQQGFVTAGGCVRHAALMTALRERIGGDVLAMLQCDTETHRSSDNWFIRLLDGSHMHTSHPVYHLVMLRFLGHTVQTFRTALCPPYLPFGQGPWPCLNPLCPVYRQRGILTYTVRSGLQRHPIATFTCATCGFAYSRTGPDTDPTDQERIGKVSEYGHLWQDHLRERWMDPHWKLYSIAEEMQADVDTIRRQAARLDLPFEDLAVYRGQRPVIYQDQIAAQCDERRRQWLQVLTEHPTGWLSQITRREQTLCRWLQRNDAEWLRDHWPNEPEREQQKVAMQRQRRQEAETRFNQQRDQALATAIRQAAQRIRAYPGRPVRINRATLSHEIGCVDLWSESRVPLHLIHAHQALAEVVETFEEFARRKLEWAARSFQEEQYHPTAKELSRRAGLYWRVLQQPAIRHLVEAQYTTMCGGQEIMR